MKENTVLVTLKIKLEVKIPLEVEHCNNPLEEQHNKDTSLRRRKISAGSPQLLLKQPGPRVHAPTGQMSWLGWLQERNSWPTSLN